MVVKDIDVYILCPKCQGTGERPGLIPDGQGGWIDPEGCPACESTGYRLIGKIDSSVQINQIMNLLKKIAKKLNIPTNEIEEVLEDE